MNITDNLDYGNFHVKTRIVVPPMATQSTEAGVPGNRTISHYQAFAQNPLVGLIIAEHSFIHAQGKADPYQMSFASNEVIPYQKNLTEAVHRENPGVKIFAQISHAGLNTLESVTGQELVSASRLQGSGGVSRALTVSEIQNIEDEFAAAALRVKRSGYDGVEIHSAHGYLLNQFYSPLTNFRTDEYGPQSMENRLRFLQETIRKIKEVVGNDFPVAVRLGGSDYMDGGSTIEDAVNASILLDKAGVRFIDLSGGLNIYMRRGHSEPGWFSDMSSAVKKQVGIPVLLTGGVRTPEQAEKLLNENKADLIGIGRAMMKNPSWGLK